MLFATLREPPKRGSLRELVLSLYVLKQQQIEHLRFRALAQIELNKEAGEKAFKDYMEAAFPWHSKAREMEDADKKRVLMAEIKKGSFAISPLIDTTFKSRLRTKVVQANEVSKQEWLPKVNRILNKVGSLIPRNE